VGLLGRRLAVSFPDTVLEEKDSLRDKTAKLGLIARACAIYGVDVIEVFKDPYGHGEQADIRKVLEFLETPQYLRRRLYPLDDALRYAGVLPPLRIPSHKPKVPVGQISVGEFREGIVNPDGTVDIGLDEAPRLKEKIQAGRRVTVRIVSLRPLSAEVVSRDKAGKYWGYAVELKDIPEVFSDPRFEVKVATSRLGAPIAKELENLSTAIRGAEGVKLIFGSPSRGLYEIVGQDLGKRADFVVNLFAQQHVETVRSEEAIFAGLGLVNNLLAGKA
jgi:predicted SPOUT superfamily RNA methylase MTH1